MAQMKLSHLFESLKADLLAIANGYGIDPKTADGGKTGLKTMWLLLTHVSRNRAYDDNHPAFAQGHWTRLLPHDGRDYCFYYENGANDDHVSSLLRAILKSL